MTLTLRPVYVSRLRVGVLPAFQAGSLVSTRRDWNQVSQLLYYAEIAKRFDIRASSNITKQKLVQNTDTCPEKFLTFPCSLSLY